ncbi:MAG: PDZ domain-containing protein [Chloroflexi bacterium]|nr:PDZ domain-containing protein [Chloroflexota bacterium]
MKLKRVLPVLFLISALVLSGCGAAVTLALSEIMDAKEPAAAPTPVVQSTPTQAVDLRAAAASNVQNMATAEITAALQSAYEQVYERVNPSVVNIQVASTSFRGFSAGEGSGFVWDQQGHIVTNNHVVDGASVVVVTFADGSTAEAEIVGTDPDADLAVIRVDVPADRLRPVVMADSSQVKVGQIAIAIGNPYGLSGTMTEGIVSALSRSLPVGETPGGTYTIPDIIQTDAAINPGNSGGVLVNIEGEVIGVTTAIRSSSNSNSGIGFVIPSNIVSRIVPVLIDTGKYEHPRLGISGMTLSSDLAAELGLPEDQRGVLVINVAANGPADKAGLQGTRQSRTGEIIGSGGDVIIAIDGHPITKFEDLTSYLFNNTEVGQTVTLTILRNGREQTVELTLEAVP